MKKRKDILRIFNKNDPRKTNITNINQTMVKEIQKGYTFINTSINFVCDMTYFYTFSGTQKCESDKNKLFTVRYSYAAFFMVKYKRIYKTLNVWKIPSYRCIQIKSNFFNHEKCDEENNTNILGDSIVKQIFQVILLHIEKLFHR